MRWKCVASLLNRLCHEERGCEALREKAAGLAVSEIQERSLGSVELISVVICELRRLVRKLSVTIVKLIAMSIEVDRMNLTTLCET